MNFRQRLKKKVKSEKGRRGAITRWAYEHACREFIARHDPIVFGEVMRRIIDINEKTGEMREIVIRDYDSAREIRRKLRKTGLTLSTTGHTTLC